MKQEAPWVFYDEDMSTAMQILHSVNLSPKSSN